jgi:hypothetical protein
MKSLKCCILCLFLTVSASLMLAQSSASVPADRILKDVVFSKLNELRITGADIDNDEHLRWVVWCEKSTQGVIVKLALVESTAKGPAVLYTLERRDAYGADIKRIADWRYGDHPVLALTYHQGAAAEQVELYGFAENHQPVRLDQRLGEVVTWGISAQGQTLLGIYAKPEGRLVPTWYRWEEKTHKLVETTNRAE